MTTAIHYHSHHHHHHHHTPRQQQQQQPHHPTAAAAPPPPPSRHHSSTHSHRMARPGPSHPRHAEFRYFQPTTATSLDDLIYGPAIPMALSERSIFEPAHYPPAIHMPPNPPARKPSLPSPSTLSLSCCWAPSPLAIPHGAAIDPLETTTREPWDPSHDDDDDYAMAHDDPSAGKQAAPASGSSRRTSSGGDNSSSSSCYYFYYCHHQHHHYCYEGAGSSIGRTDPLDDHHEQLHRRASTISDAITASSTEICRRFSSGSTSSSSVATDVTLDDDRKRPVHAPSPPPPPTTPSSSAHIDPPSSSSSSSVHLEQVHEEEEPADEDEHEEAAPAEAPVWADPARVRENPSRYEYVQAYMKQHGIAPSSPMPLPNEYMFYFWESGTAAAAAAGKHKIATDSYLSSVHPLFDCRTVWDFSSRWRMYKRLRDRPSQMLHNQNLYCFIKDVQPMWEDPRNRHGGRLTLSPPRCDLDTVFEWVLASFVGGNLDPHGMVGIVLSRRARGDRVELWLDGTADVAGLKTRLCQHMAPVFHDLVSSARFKKHFDK